MIHNKVKNSWVSWNHASYTPILVKNDNYTKSNFMHKWKINLPRVGFEPVTVRCLKNDKDLAEMKLPHWHRAIEPADV